jgi:outer membrane immunogenic protein
VKMKKLLAGSCVVVFALVAATVAQAQDFKGFYVGGNAGGAFGRASVQTSPSFSPTGYFASTSTPAITSASSQRIKPNGFTAGGQGGYNYQWDDFVFGFEVDFGRMDLSGSTSATATYPCCAPTAFTVAQSASTSWLFTARPRVGFAFGRVMFYETAGLALTSVKYSALFTDTFATAHESASLQETRPGWVVGGGVEARVTPHISIKGEYLYAGFGTATVTSTNLTAFSPPIAFPTNVFTHTVDLRAHIARGGVNFRF